VGLTITVTGNFFFQKFVPWTNAPKKAAREVFAERVFRAALPAVQLAAAPWAQRTAQVWEHGSSEHGAPLVAKGFPPVRSFRDVGQVDFEGDAIIFDVSDR